MKRLWPFTLVIALLALGVTPKKERSSGCERGSCGPASCLAQGFCYSAVSTREMMPLFKGCSNEAIIASIDTVEEWNQVLDMLTNNALEMEERDGLVILTDGLVRPSTNLVFWDRTGIFMDPAMQAAVFDPPVQVSEYLQTLTFGKTVSGTAVPTLSTLPLMPDYNLCKRPSADRESPTTTTTSTTTTPTTTTTTPTTRLPRTTWPPWITTTTWRTSTTSRPTTTTTSTTTEVQETTTTELPECPCECNASDDFGRPWQCCEDEVCNGPCPLGYAGSADWTCSACPSFLTLTPNYEGCSFNWVYYLDQLIANGHVNSLSLMMELSHFVEEFTMQNGGMMEALNFTRVSLDMLMSDQYDSHTKPANALSQLKFHTKLALDVVDKLLKMDKPWQNLTQAEEIEIGEELLGVAETYGFAVTEIAKEVDEPHFASFDTTNFYLETHLLHTGIEKDELIHFPTKATKSGSFVEIYNRGWENVTLEAVGSIISASHAGRMFKPGAIRKKSEEVKQPERLFNAEVVSLTLQGVEGEIHKIPYPGAVRVTFHHLRQAKGPTHTDTIHHQLRSGEEPTAIRDTGKCTFWNSSKGLTGEWDTSGCRLVSSNHWETVCECDHLSSFALLVDVHSYIAQSRALEVLGILCSSLSIVCLAATIFILHVLKLKHSDRTFVSKHLCLCLMLGHLLALIFIDKTYFNMPDDLCVAVGVLLHYVFLAAFAWMCIEGHHLHLRIVRVFAYARNFKRIYLVVGYGAPLVIVAITGIITASLQDHGYGDDDKCWLSSPNYVWAFMGPVLFLLSCNLVVLVAAMKVAVTSGMKQKKRTVSRIKIWLRGWFSISALLGITWIFGFLYIQVDQVFAYPFVILNGCQGVFIFVTRVLLNKQLRDELKEAFQRRKELQRFYSQTRSGKLSLGGTSSSGPMWYIGSSEVSFSLNASRRNSTLSKKRQSSDFSEAPTIEMRYVPGSNEDDPTGDHVRPSRNSRRESEVLFFIPEEDISWI